MTTTVYFDLDGTLLEYTVPFADLVARTLPANPSDGAVETFSAEVLAGIRNVEVNPYERAFRTVVEEFDLDGEPTSLAVDFVENEAAATRLLPGAKRLVTAISAHSRTGILTNGDGRMQRRKIEAHSLEQLVDAVLVSNEVGARKPDPEIFEVAKDELPADSYVYVGDTFEQDILPARKAGFVTAYVGEDRRAGATVNARRTEDLAALLCPLLDRAEPGDSFREG